MKLQRPKLPERGTALSEERRNAFAPLSWREKARELQQRLEEGGEPASAQEQRAASFHLHRPRANRVIAAAMVVSLVLAPVQVVIEVVAGGQDAVALVQGTLSEAGVYALVYYVFTLCVFAGLVAVIYYDHKWEIHKARMVTRVLMVLLLIGLLIQIIMNGLAWQTTFYLVQFVCIIAYQLYNDPNLARPPRFLRPKEGPEARAKAYELDPERRGYIPMNFFNLFWIFMLGSVVGLVIETVFMLLTTGTWKDRTCMLWGPFSPIYGVGAVLMTIAVNRWWYCNASVIFVITGLVGAALEFFVSWYLETAFGVYSWDYTGSFLSLDGRTDFAHFCAWGMLGVVWVRLLLPTIMRFVDAIPLRWRAGVTVVVAAFMLVNATMTVLALDCWTQRLMGEQPTGVTQEYFAQAYDDEFMAKRFETLKLVE